MDTALLAIVLACFNPLSTGHAHSRKNWRLTLNSVSIPYLRVTHQRIRVWYEHWDGFQSPIYGSRTSYSSCFTFASSWFQSPIYGSRTRDGFHIQIHHRQFQSPIYGSRTLRAPSYFSYKSSFNPLSTGHAPPRSAHGKTTTSGFNPLSTGHARGRKFLRMTKKYVSIPYLRVTH